MDLPGIHKLWGRNAAGAYVWRWYAWRSGGPKIWQWTGPTTAEGRAAAVAAAAEIAARYAAALGPRPLKQDARLVAGVLDAWEASDDFRAVSDSTKSERRRVLKDMRDSEIGKLPTKLLSALTAPRTMKAWRAKVASERGPRAADYRMQVLSAALNWARVEGLVSANPTLGLKKLHFSDRSEITWTGDDLSAHADAARKSSDPKEYVPPETLALMGACYSALSRQDLCALTWPQVTAHAIKGKRLKAERRARTAGKKPKVIIIPRTPELDAVLATCKTRADKWAEQRGVQPLHVFLNRRGKPWTPDGLTGVINKARDIGGPRGSDGKPTPICHADGRRKRLHDARGTFITTMKVRLPDISNAELAKMTGWAEEDVDRVAELYVDHDRVAMALLERMSKFAIKK